jgi:hypothetical protein
MKKLLITAAALLITVSTYAQGVVNFANNAATAISDVDGTLVNAADGIRVALYWAPLSDPNNFTQIGADASVAVAPPVAGTFSAGSRTTGNATAPGGVARFQVRAWELAYGSTFEAASSAPAMGGRRAKVGTSNTLEMPTGNPPLTPAASLPPNGLQPFQLAIVPEPSVVALGIMGVGALLLLRRRK